MFHFIQRPLLKGLRTGLGLRKTKTNKNKQKQQIELLNEKIKLAKNTENFTRHVRKGTKLFKIQNSKKYFIYSKLFRQKQISRISTLHLKKIL